MKKVAIRKTKVTVRDATKSLLRSMGCGPSDTSFLFREVVVDVGIEKNIDSDDVWNIDFYPKPPEEILPYFKIAEYTRDLADTLRKNLGVVVRVKRDIIGRHPRAQFHFTPRVPQVGELFSSFYQYNKYVSVRVHKCKKKAEQNVFTRFAE